MSDLKETNIEFVQRLMNFSQNGAMMQLFVIQALDTFAKIVLEEEDKVRSTMKDSIINPEAWIRCARELKGAIDAKYKG